MVVFSSMTWIEGGKRTTQTPILLPPPTTGFLPLPATDSAGCKRTVSTRITLCSFPAPLPKHLRLFIYLFPPDNGGDRVSGRVPADDTSPGTDTASKVYASLFCRKKFIFSRRKPWVWSGIQIWFLGTFFLYLLSQSSPPGGAMEELIQLQLRALIQFTVSLREIITAVKPVSTLQRGSRTKLQSCLSDIHLEY